MKTDLELSAIRDAIAAAPWTSAAIAFFAGACLALMQSRSRLGRAITSTVGAIALAALREEAMRRVASEARSWSDLQRHSGAKPATA